MAVFCFAHAKALLYSVSQNSRSRFLTHSIFFYQIKLHIFSVMLAQLEQPDALSILNAFLERMTKTHGDIITTRHYDIILQCCARCEPESNTSIALQTALDAYALLEANRDGTFLPSAVTYSHLMNTIGNQLPKTDKRREALLIRIFKKAKNEGCISYYVYSALRRCLTNKVAYDVLRPAVSKTGKLSYDNVPKEWKRRC